MTRTVHCRKYAEDLPGLDKPPMPGKRGEAIYETVSARGLGRVAGPADPADQ